MEPPRRRGDEPDYVLALREEIDRLKKLVVLLSKIAIRNALDRK